MSTVLREGTPEEAGMLPDRVERVKALAEGWVADGVTPSLVVLAARRGVIFLHEAYGVLTPEPDSPPLERDSIFPLSSLTKPITATAAMTLVEDGLLGLNRPVQDYIPEFVGEGKDAVLVHHLLTHTSGWRDEDLLAHAEGRRGTVEIPPPEANQHPTIHEIMFLRYDAPLWKPPGEEGSYCGMNYGLLGEIVRRVSGRSLAGFARERIFEPLGMEDTHYIVPESLSPRIVRRPADTPDPALNTRAHRETPSAAAGVYSTAMDMALFGQTFLNGGRSGDARILSPATVSEMTRNQIPGIGGDVFGTFNPEMSYGFGWLIHGNGKWRYYDGSLHSPDAFTHSGSGGVYLWVDPTNEIVGIYLSVVLEVTPDLEHRWNFDLVQNAIHAAIAD